MSYHIPIPLRSFAARDWLPAQVARQLWLAFTLAGGIVVLSGLLLSTAGMLMLQGLLLAVVLGLSLGSYRQILHRSNVSSTLEAPLLLASDTEVFTRYQHFTNALLAVRGQVDPLFRELALEHLDELLRRVSTIAEGTFMFEGTETWRIVYERLLRSRGLHHYRSVAWVKGDQYWQDEPGRKSLAVNVDLHTTGTLQMERIAIIADELWPADEVWPTEPLRQWLQYQHARGIAIRFVRESSLTSEPDLLVDIGIYGSRALGTQELDDACRTVRFTLTFDFAQVVAAEERWKRLVVYAESLADYLDRYEVR